MARANISRGRILKADSEHRSRYRRVTVGDGDVVPAHRAIVERRTGIKLPPTAHVHHYDPADKLTNKGILVVCQDVQYHMLLERRTRAYDECGNANWVKCRKCLKWDDPANMQSKRIGTSEFIKYWHFRYRGQCVNRGERCHIRPHNPRPMVLRRDPAAWQAFLDSADPTRTCGERDRCSCGSLEAKRLNGRYHCLSCGKQKRAGFAGRSKGTPESALTPGGGA